MSFEALPGRTTAITGSNGSGKSTLVRILAGVMGPTKGSVTLHLNGAEIENAMRPMHVGLVAPYLNVYEAFTPRENLSFIARARRMTDYSDRIDEVLESVHLLNRADDAVSTFSSGMKQRVRFATAFFTDPPVLLLDEPTANLDVKGIDMVRTLIKDAVSRNRIVIIATNDPAEAASCDDRVCVEDFL
jgi:heme exporter protein A